jgi:secreted trypsin-like serine protease
MWFNLPGILLGALIGGRLAPPSKYPFVVDFTVNGDYSCGGVIVDESTVISGAHCLPASISDLVITANRNNLDKTSKDGAIQMRAVSTHAHPKYDPEGLSYDVAVVKIEPLDAIEQRKLGLSRVKLDTGKYSHLNERLTIAGFGATNALYVPNGARNSMLMESDVPVVSCRNLLGSLEESEQWLGPSRMCAGKQVGEGDRKSDFVGIYFGDSGTPLLHMGTDGIVSVVGITSSSFYSQVDGDSGVPNYERSLEIPGLFTKISDPSVTAFIRSLMENERTGSLVGRPSRKMFSFANPIGIAHAPMIEPKVVQEVDTDHPRVTDETEGHTLQPESRMSHPFTAFEN